MKLWTSINQKTETARWAFLSRAVLAAGVENEFRPWTGELDPQRFREFHHVRVSSRLGRQLTERIKVNSTWTTLLGVIDGMIVREGTWWPLCALYESLGQIIVGCGAELDLRGNVLIAGYGGAARVGLAAFFKAGFRKFLLTSLESGETERLAQSVRTKFFGLEIEALPVENIVLLPGDTSVLFNTTPEATDNRLLNELTYLNFLKRPGYVFDMERSLESSSLARDAADGEVSLVDGFEIAARTDVVWAKWAFGVELDHQTYARGLRAALAAASADQ